MYYFDNVKELNKYYIDNNCIQKIEIIVKNSKLFELINNNDVRFWHCKKNAFDNIDGIIIKFGSWNHRFLRNDYEKAKKIKCKNFVKYLCYFEYEEDIVNFLCSYNEPDINNEINEDNAIIIFPNYIAFKNFDFKQIQDIEFKNCLKQIILTLSNKKYFIEKISIENIYVDYGIKPKKLQYIIDDVNITFKTNLIILFDEYNNTIINSADIDTVSNKRKIISNIIYVLRFFDKRTSNLISYIEGLDLIIPINILISNIIGLIGSE